MDFCSFFGSKAEIERGVRVRTLFLAQKRESIGICPKLQSDREKKRGLQEFGKLAVLCRVTNGDKVCVFLEPKK